MGVQALRGATTTTADDPTAIATATRELLGEMLARNSVHPDDLISVVFTATSDLTADFPAAAARALGISDVPLLCAQELDVPGATRRCIRVLMHLNTPLSRAELRHVYLNEARSLRTDLLDE
ncbi:MAG: chorismate mutase [Actinomycetota bacterium]|nr:chorismate mutase [Actinomycetota bacterium]